MKLVYKNNRKEVKVGDIVTTFRGERCVIKDFETPHKTNSEGRIVVRMLKTGQNKETFCGVIGAEWIERDDRE